MYMGLIYSFATGGRISNQKWKQMVALSAVFIHNGDKHVINWIFCAKLLFPLPVLDAFCAKLQIIY